MIIGIGIDIVPIDEFRKANHKGRIAEFFLTKEEISLIPKKRTDEHLASRFAAKEAVIKAFPHKLEPHDFEIIKQGVRPIVKLQPKLEKTYQVLLSLTHTKSDAAAVAIVLKKR